MTDTPRSEARPDDAMFDAWLASHKSGMHWGCMDTGECRVLRLADRQPAADTSGLPPVQTLDAWLGSAISLAELHDAEEVTVRAHMLRLVRDALSGATPEATACTCGVRIAGGVGVWKPSASCPIHATPEATAPGLTARRLAEAMVNVGAYYRVEHDGGDYTMAPRTTDNFAALIVAELARLEQQGSGS